jgi:hypothetical protein
MKKNLSRIILWGSVAVAVGLLIFFMSKEYHEPYISSKLGWLKARLVAAGLAVVLGFMSFTGGSVGRGIKEVDVERKYLKDKRDQDLSEAGYSKFEIWLIEAPLIGWVIWWVVCFQVMVSFHISDWLKYGF